MIVRRLLGKRGLLLSSPKVAIWSREEKPATYFYALCGGCPISPRAIRFQTLRIWKKYVAETVRDSTCWDHANSEGSLRKSAWSTLGALGRCLSNFSAAKRNPACI